MVYGYFQEGAYAPYVEISIFSGKNILYSPVILDTGFSGELKINHQMADELGIVAVEHASVATVYGQKIRVDFAHGFVELEGKKNVS